MEKHEDSLKKKKKKLKIEVPYYPAISLVGKYLEKYENSNLKRYMHSSAHSSTVYNIQDMEVT